MARLRHEPASRAAYLVRRRVHVRPAHIPLVGAQVSGEFCSETPTLSQKSIITIVTTVSKHAWALSHKLSLVCFAETLDIIWPCAPIIFALAKVLPSDNIRRYGDSLMV